MFYLENEDHNNFLYGIAGANAWRYKLGRIMMNRHISRQLKLKVLEYREVPVTTWRRQLCPHIINEDFRYGQNNWIRIIVGVLKESGEK